MSADPLVRLRPVTNADVYVFYEHQRDPDAIEMAAFASREEEAHVEHWRKILADDTGFTRTIEADGEVAGNCVSWLQDGHREVGYWIGKEFWGRGIATQALSLFVEEIAERPLHAWVARHNGGSIRVLEKVGFVFEREDEEHLVYRLDPERKQDDL